MRNATTGVWHWHARWSKGNGKRTPYIGIDPTIPGGNREAALACAAKWAPEARAATAKVGATFETVAKYAGRWLDDRDGRIASIAADRARMSMHVLVTLGPLDVRTFTRDDVEQLRDQLDEKITRRKLAWKTVASVWTLVTSMCADIVSAKKRDFRVRGDNPCRDVKPPERGDKKAKQYLYPSEFLQFV